MGNLLDIQRFLNLIREGKPDLVTIDCNDSVDKAIELMLRKEYSQLPVMKGDKMIGVISYEALAKNVFNYAETKAKAPSKFRVRDFMDKVSKTFNIEDDAATILDTLAERSFAFIVRRNKVTDIITSYDAMKFFKTHGTELLST